MGGPAERDSTLSSRFGCRSRSLLAAAGSASPVFGTIVQDDLGSQENKIYASKDRISFQNLFSIPGARTGDVDPLRRMGRRRFRTAALDKNTTTDGWDRKVHEGYPAPAPSPSSRPARLGSGHYWVFSAVQRGSVAQRTTST